MKKHTTLGVEEGFFDNALRDSSRVKRQIVTEYFDYYMRVMATQRQDRWARVAAKNGPKLTAHREGNCRMPKTQIHRLPRAIRFDEPSELR